MQIIARYHRIRNNNKLNIKMLREDFKNRENKKLATREIKFLLCEFLRCRKARVARSHCRP